jgi:hypothetical protein
VVGQRPFYVRALRLTYVRPGGLWCFLFFEGTIALAVLLSLAELVNWWSVVVLPLSVAGLVKINDIVAGAFARSDVTRRIPLRRRPVARGVAPAPVVPAARGRGSDATAELDAPTEVIESAALPGRAARRRAMNQRRFAPATGTRRADPRDRDR